MLSLQSVFKDFKAQGTSDHAGINFGHAGPFSTPDGTGLVQEDPDIRIFYLKVLNYPSKYHLAFYLSVLNVVKCFIVFLL